MTTNEWLSETGKLKVEGIVRPKAICKDGYSISIQASHYHYCSPREDGLDHYDEVELGYPNMEDDMINTYAEDEDYLHTVYGYVPVEIVDKLLEKHGGIVALEDHGLVICVENIF